MNLAVFIAEADLVGRRIRIAWEFVLEGGETLADIPPASLRRKERDFEFPTAGGGIDPYLVFDSSSFPPPANPPAVLVTDLPGWTSRVDGNETTFEAISVAVAVGPRAVEALRSTVATTVDPTGSPIRRRFEILDSGTLPDGLQPGTAYYYQLTCSLIPPESPARSTATAGGSYGLNRKLFDLLPAIYRRHDTLIRPITPGTDTVPEASPTGGQLRRFLDPFGIALDALRSSAENVRGLHDIDRGEARFLPLLADWIGWSLDHGQAIPLWRNEIKNAASLYRGVGTIPALRAVVNRYTGWNTQVAEFAQNLTRSNLPPQMNLFGLRRLRGTWMGSDEAAPALGFAPGNDEATGNGGPAALTSSTAEPFALRPGLRFSIAANNSLPETVQFDQDDFVRIGSATAAEVAAVLNRSLVRVRTESAPGGRVRLRSRTAGPGTSIQVRPQDPALITLEGAPQGRLSVLRDPQDRLRVFYGTADFEPPGGGAAGNSRLRFKTFAYGEWRDSQPAPEPAQATNANLPPRTDPAAVQLDGDGVWLGWVENPDTPQARLRTVQGRASSAQPALLLGQRRAPFSIPAGARLALAGNWAGVDRCDFQPGDFLDPLHATTAEVVTALNTRLIRVTASAAPSGAILLRTLETGPLARLTLDLSQSFGLTALGFDDRNRNARGAWDDTISWAGNPQVSGLPLTETLSSPGRHADLFALRDGQGAIRIFWSTHRTGLWRVQTRRGEAQAWVATNAGVSLLQPNGTWIALTTADGLASNDVRGLLTGANGTAWFATAAGLSARQATGVWRTFTTVDGLASNDTRALATDLDGTVWVATPLGLSARRADGTWSTFTTVNGLLSNNVRHVAIDPGGLPWVATDGGINARRVDGTWVGFTTANHLPSNDVRAVAFAANGRVWAATAAGAAWRDSGDWTAVAEGLPSLDVRFIVEDVQSGIWLATAAGLAVRERDGTQAVFTTNEGLPSNDLRSIAVAANGGIWVATPAGIGFRSSGQAWISLTVAQGLASNDTRGTQLGWSAAQELANGPGGNREPCAVLDPAGLLWLFWSRRTGIGTPEDAWTLRQRVFDPATAMWSAEFGTLPPPGAGRASDRESSVVILPGNQLALFFRSDRDGDTDIWTASPQLAAPALQLTKVSDGPAGDASPVAVSTNDGSLWLLFRSDRNVPLGQLAARPNASASARASAGLPDAGTLRRYAGTASVLTGALQRNRNRQLWGDLLAYTTQRPAGDPPLDPELYTRGTIGFYLSNPRNDTPITVQGIGRLRQLIGRFLPINVRAVVILTPQLGQEVIYGAGADLQENFLDLYPIAESLSGLGDSSAAALPGWVFLLSNRVGQTVANPADLTSLRRRTFFPPPQ